MLQRWSWVPAYGAPRRVPRRGPLARTTTARTPQASAAAGDRRAALPGVAVDLDALPHAVDVVGIAARERLHGAAILGIDDKDAAAGGLAVVDDQRSRRHHVDVVLFRVVEMLPMRAIEFRPRRHDARFVPGVDDEQHGRPTCSPD